MALSDTLQSLFGGGGFTLTGAVGDLGGAMDGITAGNVSIDSGELANVLQSLQGADLGAVRGAVGQAVDAGAGLGLQLPDPAQLLAPIQAIIDAAQQVTSGETLDVLRAMREAATEGAGTRELGLAGLTRPLSALVGTRNHPGVAVVLRVLDQILPGASRFQGTVDGAIEIGGAVRDVIAMLGAMMALHGAAEEIQHGGARVASLFSREEAEAAIARVVGWLDGAGLANAQAALAQLTDPNDPAQVDAVAAPIIDFLDGIRALAAVLVRGMAFGEATLVHVDPLRWVGHAQTAAASLLTASPDRIRRVAEGISARVSPILPRNLGSPVASLEEAFGRATALVGTMTAAVDGLDPSVITAPVSRAIGELTNVIREVNRVIGEIVGAVRGALETARQVIESLNLSGIVETVRGFLEPVTQAIETIDQIIGDAVGTLDSACQAINNAIVGPGGLKEQLEGIAETIRGAFGAVTNKLDELDLPTLVETLRTGVQTVVAALESAQLRPYIDASLDAINTTATVIDAVPLEMLPDDAKRELDGVVQPIIAIQFDPQVRDPLKQQLDAILNTLQNDVLGDLQDAFNDVVEFIASINPRTPLEELEHTTFDELITRIRSIDPDVILGPIQEALDTIRAAIASIDLEEVLQPVEDLFDELLAGFDSLNPAALIAPVVEAVDQVRERVIEVTGVTRWAERIEELHAAFTGFLDRIDLTALAARLDDGFDGLLAQARDPEDDTSLIGTLVASLVQGTGLPVRASSFVATADWVSGDDGAAEVRGMVAIGRTRLEETLATVRAADPGAASARAILAYRGLVEGVQAHLPTTLLRVRLDGLIARSSPIELFAPLIDNRTRYLGRLESVIAGLRSFESSGLSQVATSSQGLRAALRPLAILKDALIALLRHLGIDATGRTVNEVFADFLEVFRPGRLITTLQPFLSALKNKLASIVRDGLIDPIQAGIAEVNELIDAIDLGVISDDLSAVHAEIRGPLAALRPSVVLAEPLAAVETLQSNLTGYDPVDSIRGTIQTLQDTVVELIDEFRPTALLADVLEAYDEILAALHGLDVTNVLGPVLATLADIKDQLEGGLDEASVAFSRLRDALRSIRSGSGSVSGSVTVSA